MEKNGSSQLDLFPQSSDYGESKTQPSAGAFLRKLWIFEKALLIIIGMIVSSIVSFSLGVEKGRRMVSSNALLERASLDENKQKPIVVPVEGKRITPQGSSDLYETNTLSKGVQKKAQTFTAVKAPAQKETKGFTIQLASYKTKSNAQKEAETLKKKGLSPLFLNKGSYTVLCVGNFSSKSSAETVLSELKKQKRYSGCWIRRL